MKKQHDGGPDGQKRRRSGKKGKQDGMNQTPGSGEATEDDVIGRGLKRMFDEVVKEPIPPEFLELLNRIDRKSE